MNCRTTMDLWLRAGAVVLMTVACDGVDAVEAPDPPPSETPNGRDGQGASALSADDFDDRSLLKTEVKVGDISLAMPAFFDAKLFATLGATARHLTVRDDGVVYVRLAAASGGGSVVALRDTDGDKQADKEKRFGDRGGTGIHVYNGYLYYSTDTDIYRQRLSPDSLLPTGSRELIVKDLPPQRAHAAKPFDFDSQGHLYTMVGAPSNACMEQTRTKGSPGIDPCPQLKDHGTIWQFSATRRDQSLGDAKRYATGLRQVVALAWNPADSRLFVVQHGRDQLHDLFPEYFTTRDSAELPAEEMLALSSGFVGGWPYTYYDWRLGQRMVAPEYGGDGRRVAKAGKYPKPVQAFPGHYAPNDLLFYTAQQFPEEFRGGAFVAFHGSWNRAPHGQRGYHVAWVPGDGGKPKVFIAGFPGTRKITNPSDAKHRPMGLALGPQGELYISDSVRGAIWRVDYIGT